MKQHNHNFCYCVIFQGKYRPLLYQLSQHNNSDCNLQSQPNQIQFTLEMIRKVATLITPKYCSIAFPFCDQSSKQLNNFEVIMDNNRKWAQSMVQKNPDYFTSLVGVQKPKYLWIGCADSRVPANQIMGLKPGEVFVHRNIANVVPPSDINVLAVIQYAVQHLEVEDIIVTGHYGCGGIKAAFSQSDFGPLEAWLSYLRQLRSKHTNSLIGDQASKQDTLVELNVKQQVINVARIPVIQRAWQQNKKLFIHGLVYNLNDGILNDMGITLSKIQHVPYEFRIIQ